MIPGLTIIASDLALKDTNVRLFPASKNRSARIRKKLLKRFGSEFRKEPCAYQVGNKLIAHPVIIEQLQRKAAERHRDSYERNYFAALQMGRL